MLYLRWTLEIPIATSGGHSFNTGPLTLSCIEPTQQELRKSECVSPPATDQAQCRLATVFEREPLTIETKGSNAGKCKF